VFLGFVFISAFLLNIKEKIVFFSPHNVWELSTPDIFHVYVKVDYNVLVDSENANLFSHLQAFKRKV
jgi:hypothetical protein